MSDISLLGKDFCKDNSIVVNGNRYDIGIPVLKWDDPGGFNGYDTSKVVVEEQDRRTGKIKKKVIKGKRYGGLLGVNMPGGVHGVKKIMQHHTGGFTASSCFNTLHNMRNLSVQFITDDWGRVYQTLDAIIRAWHGGDLCGQAIGIENVLYPDFEENPYAYSKKRRDKFDLNVHTSGEQYIQGRKREVYNLPKVQVDSLIVLTAGIWAAVSNEKGPLYLSEGNLPVFIRDSFGEIVMDYSPSVKNHVGQILHANSSKMKWDMVGVSDMKKFEASVVEKFKFFVGNL